MKLGSLHSFEVILTGLKGISFFILSDSIISICFPLVYSSCLSVISLVFFLENMPFCRNFYAGPGSLARLPQK